MSRLSRLLASVLMVCLVILLSCGNVGSGQLARQRTTGKSGQYAGMTGWHIRPPGVAPWGAGPDSANDGSYACQIPEEHAEVWDTLVGSTYSTMGSRACTLRVRTLLRFGRPTPRRDARASCRIVASTDGGQNWGVVRDYGSTDFLGNEGIAMPAWTLGHERVQLAWACHVYDAANLRYWCFDDVSFERCGMPLDNCAIMDVSYPRAGMVIPPSDELPVVVIVANNGMRAYDTARLTAVCEPIGGRHFMRLEQPATGYVDTTLALSTPENVVVDLVIPNSNYPEDTGRFRLDLRLGRTTGGILVDSREDDTMTVEFVVRANCWQRLNSDYPFPGEVVDTGFAAIGTSDGALHVRSVGEGAGGRLMKYSATQGMWSSLPAHTGPHDTLEHSTPQLGGGTSVGDTLLFFLVNNRVPLMKYNLRQNVWSTTNSPWTGREPDDVALTDGIGTDDSGRVLVMGVSHILLYTPANGKWEVERDPSELNWPGHGLHQGCAVTHDAVYMVLTDGRFVCRGISDRYWSELGKLRGYNPKAVCRMTADSRSERIYFLSASGFGPGRVFVAYDYRNDKWLLNLPQPFMGAGKRRINPGAQLVCAGRWLYAINGGSNEVWAYNMPGRFY